MGPIANKNHEGKNEKDFEKKFENAWNRWTGNECNWDCCRWLQNLGFGMQILGRIGVVACNVFSFEHQFPCMCEGGLWLMLFYCGEIWFLGFRRVWYFVDQYLPFDPSWKKDQGVEPLCKSFRCQTSVGNDTDHRDFCTNRPIKGKNWSKAFVWGLKRWWIMPAKGKVKGNSSGGSLRYWRANRLLYVGINAGD